MRFVRIDLEFQQAVAWLSGKIARAFDVFAANPIRWAIYLDLIALFGMGGIFSFTENKVGYWDGVWWAFISMTTVGYGDIAPKTPEIRFMAVTIIALGIVSTALLVSALTGRVVQRRLKPVNETHELNDDLDELLDQMEDLMGRARIIQEELKRRETTKEVVA